MNRLIGLGFITVTVLACHTKEKAPPSAPERKFEGLIIDSSIKHKLDSIGLKATKYFDVEMATMDIKAFENDREVDRPLFTGKTMPCIPSSWFDDTSMSVSLVPGIMGRTGAFVITETTDTCSVKYVFSIHEASIGPYKLHRDDSLTKPGLQVPCKFTVILNQASYKIDEPVYGYVEAVSDDYYIKTDSGDTKARVEFKGYFKATNFVTRTR
jgi:hypothetical protein